MLQSIFRIHGDGNVARVVAQVLVDGHSHQVAAGRDAYAELLCCRAAALEGRLSKCCFHLTLIFLTLIFVGFRPSKIHMALSLKTRNFNFGDPTTPRTPSCSASSRL